MTINEAVKQSLAKGMKIGRPIHDGEAMLVITPTDTRDCCYIEIFLPAPCGRKAAKAPGRCWNPKAADLIADDWTVLDIPIRRGGQDGQQRM